MSPRAKRRASPRAEAVLATLGPWTPPPAEHRHTATCPWPVSDDPYRTWTYVRPSAHDEPEVTEAERLAWVAGEPFIRSGLRPQTQAALAYIARFGAHL